MVSALIFLSAAGCKILAKGGTAIDAAIAVQAGLTGHLVLSTIHSGTSAGAFTRLINMEIEPFMLASSVLGVMGLRLVREDGLTVLFVTHDLEEAIYLGDRVIALQADPGPGRPSLASMIDVRIERPRDQLTTKEHPEFLRLRRELFAFIGQGHD